MEQSVSSFQAPTTTAQNNNTRKGSLKFYISILEMYLALLGVMRGGDPTCGADIRSVIANLDILPRYAKPRVGFVLTPSPYNPKLPAYNCFAEFLQAYTITAVVSKD
jgi:hypothetical protein